MNQKQLEGAVRRMQKDSALDSERKAYLMQNIMASRYIVAQQQRVNQVQPGPSPGGSPSKTFHDPAAQTLGCPHYERKYATWCIFVHSPCLQSLHQPKHLEKKCKCLLISIGEKQCQTMSVSLK